jgi:hypothetical protein
MHGIRPTRAPILLLSCCALLALGACASTGGGSAGGSAGGSPDRLTSEQIGEYASLDVFTLVQRLRPRWLQVRGTVTAQGQASIAVILDGVRQQGSIEILRGMRATDVEELRYLNARDATTMYGTDMAAGAIQVITKR